MNNFYKQMYLKHRKTKHLMREVYRNLNAIKYMALIEKLQDEYEDFEKNPYIYLQKQYSEINRFDYQKKANVRFAYMIDNIIPGIIQAIETNFYIKLQRKNTNTIINRYKQAKQLFTLIDKRHVHHLLKQFDQSKIPITDILTQSIIYEVYTYYHNLYQKYVIK